MVNVIGDGVDAITAPEAAAYSSSVAIPAASRTTEQQAVVAAVDAKFVSVTVDWNAIQRAVSAEILTFGTTLQADLTRALRQYSERGRERAETEMFSVVTARLILMYRLLLELRERVTAGGL